MVWLFQQGLAWRPRCVKTCCQEDVFLLCMSQEDKGLTTQQPMNHDWHCILLTPYLYHCCISEGTINNYRCSAMLLPFDIWWGICSCFKVWCLVIHKKHCCIHTIFIRSWEQKYCRYILKKNEWPPLCTYRLLRMVRWMRWHCSPGTEFQIRALASEAEQTTARSRRLSTIFMSQRGKNILFTWKLPTLSTEGGSTNISF